MCILLKHNSQSLGTKLQLKEVDRGILSRGAADRLRQESSFLFRCGVVILRSKIWLWERLWLEVDIATSASSFRL